MAQLSSILFKLIITAESWNAMKGSKTVFIESSVTVLLFDNEIFWPRLLFSVTVINLLHQWIGFSIYIYHTFHFWWKSFLLQTLFWCVKLYTSVVYFLGVVSENKISVCNNNKKLSLSHFPRYLQDNWGPQTCTKVCCPPSGQTNIGKTSSSILPPKLSHLRLNHRAKTVIYTLYKHSWRNTFCIVSLMLVNISTDESWKKTLFFHYSREINER